MNEQAIAKSDVQQNSSLAAVRSAAQPVGALGRLLAMPAESDDSESDGLPTDSESDTSEDQPLAPPRPTTGESTNAPSDDMRAAVAAAASTTIAAAGGNPSGGNPSGGNPSGGNPSEEKPKRHEKSSRSSRRRHPHAAGLSHHERRALQQPPWQKMALLHRRLLNARRDAKLGWRQRPNDAKRRSKECRRSRRRPRLHPTRRLLLRPHTRCQWWRRRWWRRQ